MAEQYPGLEFFRLSPEDEAEYQRNLRSLLRPSSRKWITFDFSDASPAVLRVTQRLLRIFRPGTPAPSNEAIQANPRR